MNAMGMQYGAIPGQFQYENDQYGGGGGAFAAGGPAMRGGPGLAGSFGDPFATS